MESEKTKELKKNLSQHNNRCIALLIIVVFIAVLSITWAFNLTDVWVNEDDQDYKIAGFIGIGISIMAFIFLGLFWFKKRDKLRTDIDLSTTEQ